VSSIILSCKVFDFFLFFRWVEALNLEQKHSTFAFFHLAFPVLLQLRRWSWQPLPLRVWNLQVRLWGSDQMLTHPLPDLEPLEEQVMEPVEIAENSKIH
jgi:hypothetical protein